MACIADDNDLIYHNMYM